MPTTSGSGLTAVGAFGACESLLLRLREALTFKLISRKLAGLGSLEGDVGGMPLVAGASV